MGTFYMVLFVVAFCIFEVNSVPLPSSDDSRINFLRDRRIVARSYPHRTMMFTGYYRPRNRSNGGNQATNVYAQGNTVGGGTYFGGTEPEYLLPVPDKERPISSAEAEAAPDFEGNREHENGFGNDHGDSDQKSPSEEPSVLHTTENAVTEEVHTTLPSKQKNNPKKKKTPVFVDQDGEDELEADEYDDGPFIPFRGNKRNRGYFPFNTYFPMVFSFPGGSSRSGAPGSAPGTITAIANSYSTAKGGVASSVATAYGGTPNGRKQKQIVSNGEDEAFHKNKGVN